MILLIKNASSVGLSSIAYQIYQNTGYLVGGVGIKSLRSIGLASIAYQTYLK
jgi:hypothetical protein